MGITSTTYIKCDYVQEGKHCKKVFVLPDDPKFNTKGVEHTLSSKDAMGNTLFFCGPLHLVAHWVDFIKASPAGKEKLGPAAKIADNANANTKVVPISAEPIVPSQSQIDKLTEMNLIEPDNLELNDE